MELKTGNRFSLVIWLMGLVSAIILGLVQIVYSNLDSRIANKVDKTELAEIKREVHILILMHLNNGYEMPKGTEENESN